MIKVLNIISDSNIGGAGRCVLNFLKYYNRDEFEIKVVVPTGSLLTNEINKLGVATIEVPYIAEKSFDIKAVSVLKDVIKKEKPDIVHTHSTLSGKIAAKLCGCKIVYTRHSVFPVSKKINHGIGKFINKTVNEFLSDRIIAVAEAAKDNLTEGGISDKKIEVILNGVEQVERKSELEIKSIKQKYNINDEFVISILARLNEVKGHKYLIDSIKILKDKGYNVKLLIVGVGEVEEKLKRQVKELNLEDSVIFTGFIKDISTILSVTDLQVNASFGTEATSLALLEGMSLKIPAVVTNYGGNPGVIKQGENGLLVETKNSQKLADAIISIMSDKSLYDKMSNRCLEIFNKSFTVKIYTKNIENLYKEIL